VLLYFQHVYDKHHSFLRQPSVELELENGRVPEILLYAMMSLVNAYDENTNFTERVADMQ
jgi:hypothetical protein